jgi:acyl-CoA synthetase (AMP-forming)/AMP-acid ligase II
MTQALARTLVDLLRVRAETLGERRAYTVLGDGENETTALSYAELYMSARAVAAQLRERITPGASVILAYPPGLDFIVAFFGCLYARIIAVPVCPPHPRKGNERLAAIALDCGARHLLTTSAGARAVAAAAAEHEALAALTAITADLGTCNDPGGIAPAYLTADAVAFLQYTSGSTRNPRGVVVAHTNVLSNLAAIHAAEGNGAHSRGVSWLPAYHDMGLIEGILQPLYGGYPTWLMPHTAFLQRPARWLQAITRYAATVSGGPNFAYDLCVHRISAAELDRLDLGTWQVAYCGAEPIRAGTLDAFAARFTACGFKRPALRPVYGLAEATLLVTASAREAPGPRIVRANKSALEQGRVELAQCHADDDAAPLVSCGKPPAATRLLIIDPGTSEVLPEGQVGEICVSGPGVARGYRSADAVSDGVFHDGAIGGMRGPWLRSGDLGFMLDGELYVSGRSKDLIILRGRKLHPQDIEHTVERSHPHQIAAAAAFALEGSSGEGLVVCAEVARAQRASESTGQRTSWDAVADAIRDQVYRQHDAAVAAIAFVRAGGLARTTSGKLMRFRCRNDFATGRLPLIANFGAPARAAMLEAMR